MSIQCLSAVLADPYFTKNDKTKLLVAIAIADCTNNEDGYAWPSIDHLAERSRSTARGVQKACFEMQRDGKLLIEAGGGVNGTHAYRLIGSCASAASASSASRSSKKRVPRKRESLCSGAAVPQTVPRSNGWTRERTIQFTQTIRNRNEPSGTPSSPLPPPPAAAEQQGQGRVGVSGCAGDGEQKEKDEKPKPRLPDSATSPALPPSAPRRSGEATQRTWAPDSEEARRIAAIFGRNPNASWSARELQAYRRMDPVVSEELALVEAYYAAEQERAENHLRRSLETFLNNFPGELDRARAWQKRKNAPRQRTRAEYICPDQKTANYKNTSPFKSIV